MSVVSDYTALLSGWSWWGADVSNRPVFLTYSFETSAQSYLSDGGYSSDYIASFQPFDANDQQLARQALQQWDDVSGIHFFEVPAGRGDIRFGEYDFSLNPSLQNVAGFAYYPFVEISANNAFDSALGGDVFISQNFPNNTLLLIHEIGHSIGLKHPYDGEPLLAPDLITPQNTLYAGGRLTLGPLDIQAAQYLYGQPNADGTQVSSWLWNQNTNTLTQTGGPGNDMIRGVSVTDLMFGGGGDDVLFGSFGDDTMSGGAGNNALFGGDGNDTVVFSGVRGQYRVDSLGNGIVRVIDQRPGAPDGTDTVSQAETFVFSDETFSATTLFLQRQFLGGAGNDTLMGNEVANEMYGLAGNDNLFGEAGNDDLRGGDGNDLLYGGAGNDLFVGGAGADAFTGGAGRDEVAYQTSTAGVSVDLATGTGTGDAAGDIFGSIENLIGSSFDDYLSGDNADNYLYGLDGNDNLRGDTGDDLLIGGLGADALSGGSGNDTASYHNADDSIRVVLFQNSGRYHDAEGDTFGSIENINGSQFSDEIFGDHAANVLWGNGGNDTLEGDGGNDRLEGGEGFDKLYGQDGNDTLVGGAGQDRLFGGAGADTFVFIALSDSVAGAEDEVVEFTREHGDLIDLTMIDASTLVGGDQAFIFIGTAAFNGTAGQLHYVSGRFLEGDVDGNGTADFRVQFNNSSLQASDFIL